MRTGGGKQKGSANERRICRALSLLISNGERNDLLWRSAMSGGTATAAHRRGQLKLAQAGDISSIHRTSSWLTEEWYIECKHYADLQILRGFLNDTGNLYRFWLRTCREADRYQKKPMMFAKQNRLPELLIVNTGERLSILQSLEPVVVVTKWDADVYLFEDITDLRPEPFRGKSPPARKPRVIIEQV